MSYALIKYGISVILFMLCNDPFNYFVILSAVLEEYQESWKAIVIDEFQDTSVMQYSLLRILASHKRITIVGDEDQVHFILNTF